MEVECENFNDNEKLGTAKSAENSSACDINVKSSEKMVVNCQESVKLIDDDTVGQTAAVALAARVGLTDDEPSNEDGGSAQQSISVNAVASVVVSKTDDECMLEEAAPPRNDERSEDFSRPDPETRQPQSSEAERLLVPLSDAREVDDDDDKVEEVVEDEDDDDNVQEVVDEDDEDDDDDDDDEVEEEEEEDDDMEEMAEDDEEELEEEEVDEEVVRDEESDRELSERDHSKEASREPIDEEMESEDSRVLAMDSDAEEISSSDERDQSPDKDDSNLAVVLDSSEEEELKATNRRHRHTKQSGGERNRKKMDQQVYEDLADEDLFSSDEVDSEPSQNSDSDDEREDCDYDDLMDDIIMSKGSVKKRQKKKKKQKFDEKFLSSRITKTKSRRLLDWRSKLKKRSLKWLLTKRMHNVDEPQTTIAVDYINRSSNVASKSKPNHTSGPFIITQIESLAEKLPTTSKSPSYAPATHSKVESTEMQVDKRFDCITKSPAEDIAIKQINNQQSSTQQQLNHIKSNRDEHNKENFGNNDKLDSELQKQNGTAAEDPEKINPSLSATEVLSVFDISPILSVEILNSSEETLNVSTQDTVIEKENFISKPTVKESSSCDTNSQILKEVRIEADKVKEEDASVSLEQNKEQSEKNIQNRDNEEEIKYTIDSDKIPSRETLKIDSPKNVSSVASTSIKIEKSTLPPTLTIIDVDSPKLSPPTLIEPVAKRSRSASFEDHIADDVHPTKKLKAQLETNFPTHDQILNEYIDKTSNNSVDEIQKHLNQLFLEIQTLSDMIKAKEIEWNNMLHLKKVKEEICFRLTRKKQIMEIMSTKFGQVIEDGCGDIGADCTTPNMNFLATCVENLNNVTGSNKFSSAAVSAATTTITATASLPSKFAVAVSSTPNNSAITSAANLSNSSVLNNLSNITGISFNLQQQQQQHQNANISTSTTSCSGSSVQNILQNRANMKSSDLVKEKAITQRLHRNILPKPSSTTTSSVGGIGGGNNTKVPVSSTVSLTTGVPTIPPVSFSGNVAAPMNLINSQTSLANDQQPILNNYLTATATIQQQLGEMLNGHHNFNHSSQQQNNITNGNQTLGVGRQGAFKDVKSIIADYRQKHPETVPRRGRRMKSYMTQAEASTILGNVLKSEGKIASSDLGALLAKFDGNSRPSSNDSSHSMTNPTGTNSNTGGGGGNLGNISFKDVLIQFAKMSGQNNTDRLINTKSTLNTTQSSSIAPPPYPEVTLHPVSTSHSTGDQASGSLLHGILTKYNRPNPTSTPSSSIPTSTTQTTSAPNYNSSFSPTLARLLTAPERITSASHNTGASVLPPYHLHHNQSGSHQASTSGTGGINSTGLNISKMVAGHNSEITITPVVSSQVPTLLQQQLEHQQQQMLLKRDRIKFENFMNIKDDEADDSIDRLVIDEGDISNGPDDHLRIAPNAYGQEFHENEVPVCQGCKKQEAQFVCAGCGNQWYCSRECQVTAWDEHSEICTG